MNKTCVVMVTVSERIDSLNNFLRSLAKYEPGRDIAIHMQGEDLADQIVVPDSIHVSEYMHSKERLGCHAARVLLLARLGGRGYEVFINVDDDVELIPETNWTSAINKALEPGVGFVLTNWVKHPNALEKARTIMEDRFYPQVFVYNGGGMAYSEETAALIRDLPPVEARYDDIWPLTAFLAGRKNYRYRGSLAIHRIMSKGGMNSYMKAQPRPLLCWEWVNYRPLYGASVGSDYSIPQDSDLRPGVREIHAEARKAAGWGR